MIQRNLSFSCLLRVFLLRCFAIPIFPYISLPIMRFCSILLALRETCVWLPSTYTKEKKTMCTQYPKQIGLYNEMLLILNLDCYSSRYAVQHELYTLVSENSVIVCTPKNLYIYRIKAASYQCLEILYCKKLFVQVQA